MPFIKKLYLVLLYIFAGVGVVLVGGYFAIKLGLTKTEGIIDDQSAYFKSATSNTLAWTNGEEWTTLKNAIERDENVLSSAAHDAGIKPRLIVAQIVVEQLRLYYSDRELFKKVFYPLKILGNQSQFSWGITGIKKETAIAIENHLKDPASEFYPGKQYEHLLDFKTSDPDTERFDRITDEKDHYYNYLYAGLYLKEVMSEWHRAGFDISNRPEIVITLFNIGFDNSKPNASPSVGGSALTIGDHTYSFGGLAGEFYNSNELINIFPL